MTTLHAGEHAQARGSDTDRRSLLKSLGLGGLAAAGVAAFGSTRAAEAAGGVTVVVTNVINNQSIDLLARNKKEAVQVCAAIEQVNSILVGNILTCDVLP